MLVGLKRSILKLMLAGARHVCRREYEQRKFTRLNPHIVEYEYIFRQIMLRCPITVLDVGTGMSALPHAIANCGCVVTATDNIVDYWPNGLLNRHYHVINDDITKTRLRETFDMVSCIGVLQHVRDHAAAMRNMIGLLKPGGHLVVTTPYSERAYCPDVYKLPGSAYQPLAGFICQSYSREELDGWLRETGATLIDQEYYEFWTGKLWTQGEQVLPPRRVTADEPHQYGCFVLQRA